MHVLCSSSLPLAPVNAPSQQQHKMHHLVNEGCGVKWNGTRKSPVPGLRFAWTVTTFGNPNNQALLNADKILHESLTVAVG